MLIDELVQFLKIIQINKFVIEPFYFQGLLAVSLLLVHAGSRLTKHVLG